MKVTLLMALTVDGKIAKHANHFPDWTEKADKKMFKDITMNAGVIIMGSKTYDTIGKPLPDRKNIVLTRNPHRKSETDNLVFTNAPPKKILADLEATGADHAVLIGGATINSLFAMEGLIDELILTYCPIVFGAGISLFSDDISMDLRLTEVSRIGENSVVAKYVVIPSNT
jgi:dihydrofolate reductase